MSNEENFNGSDSGSTGAGEELTPGTSGVVVDNGVSYRVPAGTGSGGGGSKSLLAGIAVFLVIAVVAAVAYFHFASGRQKINIVTESARMAPKNTILLAAFDLNDSKELKTIFAKAVASASVKAAVEKSMAQVIPSSEAAGLLNEVMPNFRESGAFCVSSSSEKADDFNCVLIQQIKDAKEADKSMRSLQAAFEKKHPNLKYASKKIAGAEACGPDGGADGFSWLIKDNFVYIATSLQDLEAFLAPKAAGESLADSSDYQLFQKEVGKNDAFSLFLNMKQVFHGSNLDKDMRDKDIAAIAKAWRFAGAGGTIVQDPKHPFLQVKGSVYFDPGQTGDYGKRMLSDKYCLDFGSLKYHPASNSACFGINIMMIKDLVDEACKAYGASGKSMGGQVSKYMAGIDKYFTGEVVVSIKGLGRMQGRAYALGESGAAQMQGEMMKMFMSSPAVVSLGLKSHSSLEDFLKTLHVSISDFKDESIGSVETYKIPFGNIRLAVADKDAALFVNVSDSDFQKLLAKDGGISWADESVFKVGNASEIKEHSVGIICEDSSAVRSDMAYGIDSVLASKAKTAVPAEQLKEFSSLMREMSRFLDRSVTGVAVGPSGLKFSTVNTYHSVPDAPAAKDSKK